MNCLRGEISAFLLRKRLRVLREISRFVLKSEHVVQLHLRALCLLAFFHQLFGRNRTKFCWLICDCAVVSGNLACYLYVGARCLRFERPVECLLLNFLCLCDDVSDDFWQGQNH